MNEYSVNVISAATESLIDELGRVNAETAELGAKAKAIKAMLQTRIGEGEAEEGADYRAAHAVSNRTTVDWKTVAAKLKPSRQLVQAHTSVTEVHTIRVSGRVANAA